MLDPGTVWTLAFLMGAATIIGIIAFSRRGHPVGGRIRDFRAQDNPPTILQIVWPLVILVPQAYPFVVVAAPGLAYGTGLNFAFPLDTVAQIAGFLLWGLGGLLVLWSGRALGRYMVIQIAVAKDHELVTKGPYARIRHPTYTGSILIAVGAAVFFLSYVLVAVAAVVAAIAYYRARKEERLLASAAGFGDAYLRYMARTGRFLPRLGSRP